MKSQSIFQVVLIKSYKIMLIPLVIIMLFININICANQRKDFYARAKRELDEYVMDITMRFDRAIEKCDSICRYNYLINSLNNGFDTSYDAYDFSAQINEYLDSLINRHDNLELKIYFPNMGIFEDRYFLRSERHESYDYIRRELEDQKTSILWNDELYQNGEKGTYFKFYKIVKLKEDIIMEFRVYIEDMAENVKIVKSDSGNEKKGYVTQEINSHFEAFYKLDYSQIYKKWLLTTGIILLIIALLAVALYIAVKMTIAIATRSIREFIDMLKPAGFIESKIELEIEGNEFSETQVIKKTIIELLDKVQENSQLYYEAELDKKKVKFELLQSQLNSHFIYNSLSALRLGAAKHKDDDMVKLVDNLVSYYRLVLSKGKNMVTLKEELSMIRKYVEIIKMSQFVDYNIEIEVLQGVSNVQIPHMLLQPLVENALVHGLGGTKRDRHILRISCSEDSGYLVIKIRDNGRGMSDEVLKRINTLSESSDYYGIKNVYLRLALTYGSEGTISFTSKKDEGTEVTVKLPAKLN